YRWLIGSAVVLLMLAAGDMFPLRMWVAKLPGLGLFRHPSIFRFFLIFCLCLMAALSWEKLAGNRRVLIRSLLVVATGILAVIIFMWPGNVLSLMSSTWRRWNDVSLPVELPAPSRIFFQATIHLVLLTLAALLVWKSKTRWWPLLIAMDMVIAVQLNAPATIYTPLQTAEMNRQLEEAIASRSPYAGQPLIMMGGDSLRAGVDMIWRNEGIFLHLPQWDGYNSFVHRAYSQLEDSGELNVLIHRPLVFFENDSTSLVPQRFTGGRMEMNVSTGATSSLVVMQNYMPGWKAELNGRPITIAPYRNAFLQMQIPPGAHKLTLHYSPNWIYWLAALWVGWVGMIIVYMMKGRGI
ncbi:MAG: YfhO family protein, partial [Flavobacteriales bacterium]|nr:YfhO family protein [Flavobacteriales bacterium]